MIGIVLAGGNATRMGGGDKGLIEIGGRTILERVLGILRPQCGAVVINANDDAARLAPYACPVVPDSVPGRPGPLAGLLAGLDYAATHHPDAAFAVTVPWDAPFLPVDLVARLEDRRVADRATICRAASGDHVHGVVALWSLTLREDLRRALVDEGVRKVGAFAQRHAVATVAWPSLPFDPFLNLNTREDVALAQRIAAAL